MYLPTGDRMYEVEEDHHRTVFHTLTNVGQLTTEGICHMWPHAVEAETSSRLAWEGYTPPSFSPLVPDALSSALAPAAGR